MKTIRIKSAFTVAVALLGTVLTGCQNNNRSEILKPIDKNLLGSWELTCSAELNDQGDTLDVSDLQGSSFIYRFKDNGKLLNIRTMPDRNLELRSHNWTADDQQNTYTVEGKTPTTITLLTTDNLEYRTDTVMRHDGKTVTPKPGIYVFSMKRISDDLSPAEQILGKWAYKQTDEKVEGKWSEKTYKYPFESSRDFMDNGRVAIYQKAGDNAQNHETNWRINVKTGELCLYEGERKMTGRMELVNDSTMYIYYDQDLDVDSGKEIPGEFREVCVRVSK